MQKNQKSSDSGLKTILRELGLSFPDILLFTCNCFQALDKIKYFEEMGDHADEMETSLIMHLQPHLITPLKEAGNGVEKKSVISGLREKWTWAERKKSEVTEDIGIGNPKNPPLKKGGFILKMSSIKWLS
ncbi:creatininase family protein [Algoriphagus lutimaris]|uniref:creatininase family protein n=1 Tax=Algoriphagus lutimaris TaxID=613197 RepID=UPI00293D598E|nr:creatininase family protein [Algoriphagus lutimaris]